MLGGPLLRTRLPLRGVRLVPGPLEARPRKPRDKANVETGVLIVQRWILARLRHRRFFSLEELNTRSPSSLTSSISDPSNDCLACSKPAMHGVTAAMASDHERRNRQENEDFRRQLFAVQLGLLHKLDPDWERRRRSGLNEVLEAHPFSDDLGPRTRPRA